MFGIAVTYQQVAMQPALFRKICSEKSTCVILDEVHHCGEKLSWGDAVQEAFDPARIRLMLSGTPFRSDQSAIPYLAYHPTTKKLIANVTYTYVDALEQKVCRPVNFYRRGGSMSWMDRNAVLTEAGSRR